MDHLRALVKNHEFEKAKELCNTMLNGELKYRCDVAEFWMLYATAEKVLLVFFYNIIESGNIQFCDRCI